MLTKEVKNKGGIMPVYKFTYLNFQGRGELSRLLFAYQGQKYEDNRIRVRDWPAYRSQTPYGQVPVLEIDGKAYTETSAINNYLASQFGLHGKTALERLEIDQVVGKTVEVKTFIIDWFHAILAENGKADEMQKENLEVNFPRSLKIFEKLLEENGTGFYVGNEITYADIAVFDVLDIQFSDSLLEKFPKVKANRDMVRNHPRLKNYITTRKVSRL